MRSGFHRMSRLKSLAAAACALALLGAVFVSAGKQNGEANVRGLNNQVLQDLAQLQSNPSVASPEFRAQVRQLLRQRQRHCKSREMTFPVQLRNGRTDAPILRL